MLHKETKGVTLFTPPINCAGVYARVCRFGSVNVIRANLGLFDIAQWKSGLEHAH